MYWVDLNGGGPPSGGFEILAPPLGPPIRRLELLAPLTTLGRLLQDLKTVPWGSRVWVPGMVGKRGSRYSGFPRENVRVARGWGDSDSLPRYALRVALRLSGSSASSSDLAEDADLPPTFWRRRRLLQQGFRGVRSQLAEHDPDRAAYRNYVVALDVPVPVPLPSSHPAASL